MSFSICVIVRTESSVRGSCEGCIFYSVRVAVAPRSLRCPSSSFHRGQLEMRSTTTEQVIPGIGPNDSEPSSASRSVLAYLGPAGTYSHQVYLILAFTRLRAQGISYRPRIIDFLTPWTTYPRIPSQVRAEPL